MPRNPVLTLRLPQDVFNALARERQLRHLNVSAWARKAVLDAFQRDFPNTAQDEEKPARRSRATQDAQAASETETPPLRGWWACQLTQGGLGARHDDPASLPRQLVGQQIEVNTTSGKRFLSWILEVVDRSDEQVRVRDGREKP